MNSLSKRKWHLGRCFRLSPRHTSVASLTPPTYYAEQNYDVPIGECDYADPCEAINNNDLSALLNTLEGIPTLVYVPETVVVQMTGGITALLAAKTLGPRIG